MSGKILRSADNKHMPWKNGGGVTAEIWKATAPDGEILWRLSVAEVASDGPFSSFPGIDRWIMLVEGKGMELDIAGQGTHRIERAFEPLAFSGDAKTTCRLISGKVRDFNLMVARNHAKGSLRVLALAAGEARNLDPGTAAFYVLDGCIEITGDLLATDDTWIAGTGQPPAISTPRPSRIAVVTLDAKGKPA